MISNDNHFITIKLAIKRHLEITFTEYGLCEMIYHLSNHPNSRHPGWSYASNKYYADALDISGRQVQRVKSKMVDRGLLERHPDHQTFIRTTIEWYQAAQRNYHDMMSPPGSPEGRHDDTPPTTERRPPHDTTSPNTYRDTPSDKVGREERKKAGGLKDISAIKGDQPNEEITAPAAPPQPGTMQWFAAEISGAGILEDTPANRAAVWKIVEPYLQTEEFSSCWPLWAGKHESDIEPADVFRRWIIKAKRWDWVRTFQANKISGWVQFTNVKNSDNGSGQENYLGGEPAGNSDHEF